MSDAGNIGGAVPPGLKLAREIMTPAEEQGLIALIEASGLSYYAMDPDNPRSSKSYGWKYDFRNDSFVPCEPIPEGFRPICEKAARFANVEPEDFAECLLNRYEPGAIIQPHSDKPVWEHIIGISLGSAETMTFSKPSDAAQADIDIVLEPRSMFLLSGEARHVYHHSLPPVKSMRWSITLRTFSDEGVRLRDRRVAA